MAYKPFVLTLLFLSVSCVSTRMSDRAPDRLFREGRYESAAGELLKGLEEDGGEKSKDHLLWILDLGLAYHSAGKYEESNKYLLAADKIAEIKDYTSLAKEGATLLVSENIQDYKGEDFEKVLINTYLAMNFALLGNFESALVEARRVNRKLRLMITEGKRKYKQNAFARYLAGVLYEAEGEWDDAYLDYKKTYELDPNYPTIGDDLWRLSKILRRFDDMAKWKKQFKLSKADRKRAEASASWNNKGEIIVLYQNGISPIKDEHPSWHSIPKFYPRFNPVYSARVAVNGKDYGDTAVLHDIQATAIKNLDDKYAGIVAKKVAGAVTKKVVADKIGEATDNPMLGVLANLVFHYSDRADVRSWNLLPKDLQLARIVVKPGVHTVRLTTNGLEHALPEKVVKVSARKKVFVDFRYTPN